MDFMYDFLMFQHGKHNTKEKLEYYQYFIMILLGELKDLHKGMCISCQQKCALSKAARSGVVVPDDLPQHDVVSMGTSRMPKVDAFRRTPAPGSSSPPINERIPSESRSLSTERGNESDIPILHAERGSLTYSTIDVTLVRSFCHKNYARCVCFSHDGKYMAVGTGNSSIFIYEVDTHVKYCELREYASQYRSYTRPLIRFLYFSANGRYLAVADAARRVIIWDLPNKRIHSIFQWNVWLFEVRFSPNGRLVTFRSDEGLVVLNMRDNSRKMVSEGSCFDFKPGGRLIAAGNDGVLLILDVRTGKAVKRWNGHGAFLRRVKFTLDGRGLLCVYGDMIEQWDVNFDADSPDLPVLIRKFDVPTYFYPAISPDHQLVAFANELWDVNSAQLQCTLQGHNDPIRCVHFSAAGTYFAMGSYDGFVSLWRYSMI